MKYNVKMDLISKGIDKNNSDKISRILCKLVKEPNKILIEKKENKSTIKFDNNSLKCEFKIDEYLRLSLTMISRDTNKILHLKDNYQNFEDIYFIQNCNDGIYYIHKTDENKLNELFNDNMQALTIDFYDKDTYMYFSKLEMIEYLLSSTCSNGIVPDYIEQIELQESDIFDFIYRLYFNSEIFIEHIKRQNDRKKLKFMKE